MSHVLLIFGTGEGQTKRIADEIANCLAADGHFVTQMYGDDWPVKRDATVYDAFIVGASIHADSHQRYMIEWITQHRDLLVEKPSAFFSVSLSAKDQEDSENYHKAAQYVLNMISETNWNPLMTASFAGALPFARMSFLKKLALGLVMRQSGETYDLNSNYEFTNWDRVRAFAHTFSRILRPDSSQLVQPVTMNKFADFDVPVM